MTDVERLDGNFVLRELRGAARLPALEPAPPRVRIERKIQECLAAFRKHQGVSHRRARPPHVLQLEDQLVLCLKILGRVLNLERTISCFKQIIQVDWLAHLDLAKDKRYRDHITHPACVTAIGWWMLHRKGGKLLKHLGRYYKQVTRTYCLEQGLRPPDWRKVVEYAWLAAGLLHDSAYPMEYHLRSRVRLLSGAKDPLQILIPRQDVFSDAGMQADLLAPLDGSWFYGEIGDLSCRFRNARRKKFKHAHSLLAAVHHLLLVEGNGKERGLHLPPGLVAQLAARAILVHHDAEDNLVISDPLSTLLVVADTLQAWYRPFLHRRAANGRLGGVNIRPLVECRCLELVAEKEGYTVKFCMNNSDDRLILRGKPYVWTFDRFCESNRHLEQRLLKYNLRMERLNRGEGKLPLLVASRRSCIKPAAFLQFMEARAKCTPAWKLDRALTGKQDAV